MKKIFSVPPALSAFLLAFPHLLSAQQNVDLAALVSTDGFHMDGSTTYDAAGRNVASAGDVNGDGFADVIVSAYVANNNGRTRSGSCYVIFGKATGFGNLDLADFSSAGPNGFRIDGAAAYDYCGSGIASAGDVNGDGYTDLIVSAYRADNNGRANSGSCYVIFGKGTGLANIDLANFSAAGPDGFRVDGSANGSSVRSVASAGDVNGDGYNDVIVGASGESNNGRNSSGSCYVVFGKATGFTNLDLADFSAAGPNGFRIDGAAASNSAGNAISSAGDVNGDGYADVIVGASASNNGRNLSGSSYVVFGKATGFANIDLAAFSSAGPNGFRIDGAAMFDFSSNAVSSAGDVNGDGYTDVIVGAGNAGNNGRGASGSSYVVFGKQAGAANIDLATFSTANPNGFRIDGAEAGNASGRSVACAGDVNGDGYADVIVGAHVASNNGRIASGSSYVFFGKATGFINVDLAVFSSTGPYGFRIDGAAGDDRLGRCVSSAGDVNGDGFSDLIVGAYAADNNGRNGSGSGYVVFGGHGPRTYQSTIAAGNAPRTQVASVNKNDALPGSVWIDFDAGDAASTQTVKVYTRGRAGIGGITPVSDTGNTVWQITTTRTGWTSAVVTIRYPDSAEPYESDLKIYKAENASGPWTRLTTTVDSARNQASATVSGFSYFALGKSNVLPLGLSKFSLE